MQTASLWHNASMQRESQFVTAIDNQRLKIAAPIGLIEVLLQSTLINKHMNKNKHCRNGIRGDPQGMCELKMMMQTILKPMLPFQGAICIVAFFPRAMPWARIYWAFSP